MNFAELLVILLVAIAVFSPKHLPELARTCSTALRTLRRLSTDLKSTVEEAVQKEELAEKERKAERADQHYREQSNKNPP